METFSNHTTALFAPQNSASLPNTQPSSPSHSRGWKLKGIIPGVLLLGVFIISLLGGKVWGQVQYRATSTNTSTSTTTASITVSKPTGVATGDIMIACISQYAYSSTVGNASLSGWTLVKGGLIGGLYSYSTVLYKLATASEPSSYTFTIVSPNKTAASIVAFSNVDGSGGVGPAGTGTGPFSCGVNNFSTSASNSSALSVSAISPSSTNSGIISVGLCGYYGNTMSNWTCTNPASLTEIADIACQDWASVGVAWANKSTTGTTGSGSIRFTGGSGYYGGLLIGLKSISCSAPTVAATTSASSVTQCSASTGGNVTADGGCAITARGVCYGTSANPTTANTVVTASGTTESFTSSLKGLKPRTT